MLVTVLVGVLFATLAGIALVRSERILPLAIFLAPWQGLDVDLGLRITAFRIVAGALVTAGLVRIVLGRQRLWAQPSGIFWVFVGYGVLLSLVQIPDGTEAEVAGGGLRGSTPRALLQILLFAVELALIPVVAQMIRGPEWIRRAAKVYIVSCVALSILGWLQVGMWLSSGWNPFPIGLVNSVVSRASADGLGMLREGAFDLHGTTIVRMSALGGEPKGLGTGLAVGLVMIQAALGTGAVVLSRRVVGVWLLLFASMLATFSTSGLVLWALGSLVGIMIGIRARSGILRGAVVVGGLLVLAATVALTAAAWAGVGNGVDWWELAIERTVGRDYIEDFDEAIGLFLIDHPTTGILGVGLGNIHLYADDYLPGYAGTYAGGTAFTAKSGALRLVSELGLVGLLLFLAWLVAQIRSANRFMRHVERARAWTGPDQATVACLVQLSAVAGLMYLARGSYVSPQAFLMFGVLCAVGVRRSVTIGASVGLPAASAPSPLGRLQRVVK